MSHRLNWRPDKPDIRDLKYEPPLAADPDSLIPASADLRPLQSPVHDQGDIGSCTGNAIASALEFLELKALSENGTKLPEEFGSDYANLSRLFIYYNERFIEGDVNRDGGAEIRDGMKAIKMWGVCPEKMWEYLDALKFERPSVEAYSLARNHKISSYMRLDNTKLFQLKACLADGFPFVMGFTVYSSFMDKEVASTGVMSMPRPTDKVEGGHAVLCVGYDDSYGRAIIKNSWGTGWGDKGYFYMPYEYIAAPDLAADFWTVRT